MSAKDRPRPGGVPTHPGRYMRRRPTDCAGRMPIGFRPSARPGQPARRKALDELRFYDRLARSAGDHYNHGPATTRRPHGPRMGPHGPAWARIDADQ